MNRMLRTKSGPRREEVTANGIKLHKEEFHDFLSLLNIIRMINIRTLR
jgi:hypothetical protein